MTQRRIRSPFFLAPPTISSPWKSPAILTGSSVSSKNFLCTHTRVTQMGPVRFAVSRLAGMPFSIIPHRPIWFTPLNKERECVVSYWTAARRFV